MAARYWGRLEGHLRQELDGADGLHPQLVLQSGELVSANGSSEHKTDRGPASRNGTSTRGQQVATVGLPRNIDVVDIEIDPEGQVPCFHSSQLYGVGRATRRIWATPGRGHSDLGVGCLRCKPVSAAPRAAARPEGCD